MKQGLARIQRLLLCCALAIAAAGPARAATAVEDKAQAMAQVQEAVVGLRAQALADARSIDALGRERLGSGIVIGADGLVLTIGYLILEAEEVDLELADGRRVPASVVAYDPASGFGLVLPLTPLARAPAPLGRSSRLSVGEPLLIVTGGEDGQASLARLVSRRAFSGSWEYHIDGALFTAPPRPDHSGAALFNADGELQGVGSLIVADALGPGQPRMVGNMFVPIDLLGPILGELRAHGSSRQSHRPWLGVNCVELAGEVRVLRVSRDSPAEAAGIEPGDRIQRVDGQRVAALAAFYAALWQGAAERDVTLEILRGDASRTVKLRSVDRLQTLRQARGI